MSKLKRETKETRTVADVRIGSGAAKVETGDRFLTHMVETLARYSGVDIDLEASGDLRHPCHQGTPRVNSSTCTNFSF